MAVAKPSAGLPAWEALLDRFDQAWRTGPPPSVEALLREAAPANHAAELSLLGELIKLDLEYRWRTGVSVLVEAYGQRFPRLPGAPGFFEVVLAEYWARLQWGDRPAHEDYLRRFPSQAAQLAKGLSELDARLAAEFPRQPTTKPAMTSGALWQWMQTRPFLTAPQRDQLTREFAAQLGDSQALARELIRRGWLTPYQANQLLQGRGQDLLIGPFLIQERLGEGGTGQVFKARHLRLDRQVALKLLRKELLRDPEVVRRFQREVKLISKVNPNVIRALDASVEGDIASLSMEYVEGTDLQLVVKNQGPVPVADACEVIRQAALGLQHIHEHGLVHRDIKPSNLLVGEPQASSGPSRSWTWGWHGEAARFPVKSPAS
jgi:hypothetical protein